jgi:hypothetical protein
MRNVQADARYDFWRSVNALDFNRAGHVMRYHPEVFRVYRGKVQIWDSEEFVSVDMDFENPDVRDSVVNAFLEPLPASVVEIERFYWHRMNGYHKRAVTLYVDGVALRGKVDELAVELVRKQAENNPVHWARRSKTLWDQHWSMHSVCSELGIKYNNEAIPVSRQKDL